MTQQNVKTIAGRTRPRSARPPIRIPAVTHANSIWKKLYRISGRSGDPGEGSASTPINPKFLRFPINPLDADVENANEYPQKYHWNMTMALLAATAQMRDTGRKRKLLNDRKTRKLKRTNARAFAEIAQSTGRLEGSVSISETGEQDFALTQPGYHEENHRASHRDKR